MTVRALLAWLRFGAALSVVIVVPVLWRVMSWLPWQIDCLIAAAAALAFAYRFERTQAG